MGASEGEALERSRGAEHSRAEETQAVTLAPRCQMRAHNWYRLSRLPCRRARMSGTCACQGAGLYQLRPLQLGAEVLGVDLQGEVNPAVVQQLREDVHRQGARVLTWLVWR